MKKISDFFDPESILWRRRIKGAIREIALVKDGDNLKIVQLFNKSRVHFLQHSTVDDDKIIMQEIVLPPATACQLALAIKKHYRGET